MTTFLSGTMNSFNIFLKRCTRRDKSIVIVGQSGVGKTSILYTLKTGEFPQVVAPTIGVMRNVETIYRHGYNITAWDLGDFFPSNFWSQYYSSADGIIFVIDSTAPHGWSDYDGPPRIYPHADTTWEGLDFLLQKDKLDGVPILILANKQDLPNAMGRDEIIKKLGMHRWPWAKWKLQLCSAHTGAGLQEGFDWLIQAGAPADIFERHRSYVRATHGNIGEVYLRAFLSDILCLHSDVANGWLSQRADFKGIGEVRAWVEQQNRIAMNIPLIGARKTVNNIWNTPKDIFIPLMRTFLKRKDTPEDIFIASLEDSSFMATHQYDQTTGREFRFDHYYQLRLIWLYFRKYDSRRESLEQIFKVFEQLQGESYNLTLTYFWAHMVHYSIYSQITQTDDFKTFLTINPCVTDSKLYLQYYDEGVVNSDDAKKEMILPKKKILPSIMMKNQGYGEKAKKAMSDHEAKRSNDSEFIKAFESDQLSGWGHEYFIRVIFCYLNTLPRKAALDKCFSEFERVQGKGHHLTLTFFWFTLVESKRAGFKAFAQLWAKHKGELGNALLWRDYYNDEVIDNPASAIEMRLPDKKQNCSLFKTIVVDIKTVII